MHLPHLFARPHRNKLTLGTRGPFGLLPLSILLDNFNSHLYVVGQSGQGKSKFLQHLLHQLTFTTWGCGVLDPHSDLASDLIAQLYASGWLSNPKNYKRIIYLDPSRTDYLLPTNILKNSVTTPYEIAENVVEAFRRVWPATLSEAPRFAQILRNAVLVLAQRGLTLVELEPFLTRSTLRMRLLENFPDPQVISFFATQYNRWGKDQVIMASPVLNKVSAFLFQPTVRAMLGADDNCLDFRHIMDSGKVLIVDLGGFAGETQQLLGSLIMTSLEQAAFSRRTLVSQERRPFFCMVDEFPLFCARDSTTLARILSESRKYRLHLGLAHQTISQLPTERLQGALENTKLKVVFGTGRQTAEAIVKELFMPDLTSVKHEVEDTEAQDRTHPIFDPMMEQFEKFTQMIQRLRRQHVLVTLPESETVATVRVPTVPSSRVRSAHLERLKTYLARQWGRPRRDLEQEIDTRTHQLDTGQYNGLPVQNKRARMDFWVSADQTRKTPLLPLG